MNTHPMKVSALAALLLTGCVTVPEGPSMLVLPGKGMSFDQFRADDLECRQYASTQAGGASANQAATDSAVKSAVVGTVLGAAAGAAIDGHSGAGTGAGIGLLFGALAGTGAAQGSAYGAQRRYDNGYVQCMYAKGHKVPTTGRASYYPRRGYYYPPPPPPDY